MEEAYLMGGTSLGERVLERRLALGMSQRELAGEEVSPSYVSLIESGKRWPTLDVLEVLGRRLRTTASALVSDTEQAAQLGLERIELDLKWAKIAMCAGEPGSAQQYARAVLNDTACSVGHRIDALMLVAAAAEAQGLLDEAIGVLEPLVDELDSDRTREMWRSCQVMLCRCYKDVGDLGHAIDLGERALASDAMMSDEQVMLAISLGDAYFRRGDIKRADRLLSRILRRVEVAGSHRNQGAALWNASLVAEADDRLDDAVRLAERALALFSESDAVRNLGRLRVTYAFLLREESTGSVPLAREQLRRARGEFELEGTVIERARCLTELARCSLDEDDLVEAKELVAQAAAVIAGGPAVEHAKVELVHGHTLVRSGEIEKGLAAAHEAARVLDDQSGSSREAAHAWRELAALARSVSHQELMVDALEHAVDALGIRPTRVGTERFTKRFGSWSAAAESISR
ncbi:MAG: helix-turn-helix domain-containing protein [Actinomycetota bacterium]|nr:helix-turn-helix domain-containing protein [Actinomycetota bacterium]